MYVGCDSYEVYLALFLGEDIGLVVRLFGVRHDRDFYVAFIISDYAVYIVFVAEAPRTKFGRGKYFVAVFVAYFHVIYPGVGAGVVYGANLFVCKLARVHQTAVSYCAVEHF